MAQPAAYAEPTGPAPRSRRRHDGGAGAGPDVRSASAAHQPRAPSTIDASRGDRLETAALGVQASTRRSGRCDARNRRHARASASRSPCPDDAPLDAARTSRAPSIQRSRATRSPTRRSSAGPPPSPPLRRVARYTVDGVPVRDRAQAVARREAQPALRRRDCASSRVVPALAVTVTPAHGDRAPRAAPTQARRRSTVELLNNARRRHRRRALTLQAARRLDVGAGQPTPLRVSRGRASARVYRFTVSRAARSRTRGYDDRRRSRRPSGREYQRRLRGHRAPRSRGALSLSRRRRSTVRGIDVTIAPDLKVGYVMGVGDQVPRGLAQLGAQVTLLGEQELATGRSVGSSTPS